MYKVGVMIMGRADSNNTTVKQIVMEVQPKTKIRNIFDYLLQLDKIADSRVYIALQKKGRPIGDDSNIKEILKHTKPTNGVIRLFLYEQTEQQSQERLDLKRSRQQVGSSNIIINSDRGKITNRDKSEQQGQKKRCCCF